MHSAVTANSLAQGLRGLGVRPGQALEVHCALGSFGYVEGGAETVIDTLLREVEPSGAIVMPAFRLSPHLPLTDEDRRLGLTAKIRILPEDAERSAMGIVADTFRRRPDVRLGSGVFRTAAWGREAEMHAKGFQHLIDSGGYALLLGVDIYSLSAMHYVEDVMPDGIRARFVPSAEARAKYPEGQWLIEAWAPPVKPWYAIQEQAYARGLVSEIQIGGARCMYFQVLPVIELYRRALLERPYELYGLYAHR